MSDERADTDNRVVDVLWKLVAECLPDFFVRLASKTVGSSITRDIRYGFEIPYDDVWHVTAQRGALPDEKGH